MNNIDLQIEYLEHFPTGKNLINKNNPFVLNLIYASTEILHLHPFDRLFLPTGIKIRFPENLYGYLMPYEQLVFRRGLTIMSAGVFTSNYEDEIEVLLTNMDEKVHILNPYTKIGEMLINSASKLNFNLNLKKKVYNKRTLNYKGEIGDDGIRMG